ncbi:b3 domain-containing protein [Quercus suber]|uniref:B3 domain-containing protein n=1 Tax=Quercus suber TaxID=58331 RepID=A0AAW0KQ06_QUESU
MAVADQKQSQCPTVSSPKKRRRPAKTMGKLLLKKVPGFNQMADKQAVNNKNLQGAASFFFKYSPKRLKRATVDSLYDTFEAQSCVLEQAKEIQANLEPEFHSLVKTMLPSNVTGGFWLGLPKHFCRAHLPMQDTAIVLEDESGEAFETKYLAEKVYIVRSNGSDEVDGALALLKLDAGMKLMKYDKDTKACEEPVYEALKTLSQENTQKNSIMVCVTDPGPMVDLSEDDSDIGSEILDGIRLSDSVVDFKQVRSIEDFSVLVNGLVINSELPKFLLTKYFELCCSQKSFLHEHLLEGLNCKLAAGMISETINVADAIRACKISTSQESLSTWDKTLKAFEVLGMNVGFLRARLEQLLNISLKLKRYKEATLVRAQAEEEVQTLEAKLLEVKEKINSLDAEIENLDVAADKLELAFQEVANAPW